MKDYVVVGLTGQSGAGKTTVSECFGQKGFYIINCDNVSRKVTEQGSDCNKELCKAFPDCFDDFLTLDRAKLGKTVFGNSEKLEALNEIIFPYIINYIDNEIEYAVNNGSVYILLDAPTLFEAKMESSCDYIVSVVANFDIRVNRVAMRDNISRELIRDRFNSQHSESFFVEKSDFVVKNNSDEMSAHQQTFEIIDKIKEMTDVTQQAKD